MADSPLPLLLRGDHARPCGLARLPDDCLARVLELAATETVPCLRAACRALRAAARARRAERVPPVAMIRSGLSVAAWAWAQPAFRNAAGRIVQQACAELGHLELLRRALAHRDDEDPIRRDLWVGAGEAGHAHVLAWLLARAAWLTTGSATHLDFNGCRIDAAVALHLSSALRDDASVRQINFRYNRLGPEGAMYLADALRVNATVLSFNLWRNDIGDDGALHIAEALKVNATLTQLSLYDNRIGPDSTAHLSEALRRNSRLTKLDLRHNALTTTSKERIRKAWRHGPGLQL